MSASWYDVLGVDEHASPAEIRTAWKDSIADLSPGDRKFRVCNEAAEVLLDPERRAAYDAELGIAPAADVAEATPRRRRGRRAPIEPRGRRSSRTDARVGGAGRSPRRRPARCRPCPAG